ncbi:hypothetical protein ACFE04_007164 [Oxalis oulophora]
MRKTRKSAKASSAETSLPPIIVDKKKSTLTQKVAPAKWARAGFPTLASTTSSSALTSPDQPLGTTSLQGGSTTSSPLRVNVLSPSKTSQGSSIILSPCKKSSGNPSLVKKFIFKAVPLCLLCGTHVTPSNLAMGDFHGNLLVTLFLLRSFLSALY